MTTAVTARPRICAAGSRNAPALSRTKAHARWMTEAGRNADLSRFTCESTAYAYSKAVDRDGLDDGRQWMLWRRGDVRVSGALAATMAVVAVLAAMWPAAANAAGDASGEALSAPACGDGQQHEIAYDKYSLMIDGKREYVWSGEFHPFRLPSPGLWRDMLQKYKANGFNTVSLYFDWAQHSPKQGVYDFEGIRDVDRLLDMAEQAGLYVIVRPGPYINAEADSGGFPGWLQTQAGRARTSADDYQAAWEEYFDHINAIIARHQLVDGGGSVILYQIENEYTGTNATGQEYM